MKQGIIAIAISTGVVSIPAQTSTTSSGNDTTPDYKFRKVENRAFKAGEVLDFRMHYGFVDAGVARLEVKDEGKKLAGRKVLHIIGTGKSTGAFDFFYKVRDRYESYIDAEGIFPWVFVRRVDEGGYKFSQDYTFIQHRKQVNNGEGKIIDVPAYVHDMVSAFYYARTLNLANTRIGDTITVYSFVDDELFPLRIRYAGKETVKVDAGTFRCLKFHPVVQKGRVFRSEEDLTVYISDDGNKIPVLAKADVLVGSIKMELKAYQGLANPPARIK